MTTIEFPTFQQAQARREHMDDLRAVMNALSDPVIDLPHEFTPYGMSIQVRDAQNRCQIEGALVDYGFSFGEDEPWTDRAGDAWLWRPILRCERPVGKLYGRVEHFASTPALLDELVDNPQPLSDLATIALLDAIAGDAVEWVSVGEVGEVTGDDIPAPSHHQIAMPSGWRTRALGGLREYVEPV